MVLSVEVLVDGNAPSTPFTDDALVPEHPCFRSSQSSLKLSMPKIYWSSTRFEFLKIALFPWNRLVILILIGSALNYGAPGYPCGEPHGFHADARV